MNNFYKVLEMVQNRTGCIGIVTKSVPTKFWTDCKSKSALTAGSKLSQNCPKSGSNFWNQPGDSDNGSKMDTKMPNFCSMSCI